MGEIDYIRRRIHAAATDWTACSIDHHTWPILHLSGHKTITDAWVSANNARSSSARYWNVIPTILFERCTCLNDVRVCAGYMPRPPKILHTTDYLKFIYGIATDKHYRLACKRLFEGFDFDVHPFPL